MADLPNDAATLRLRIDLVDREAPLRGPVPVLSADGTAPSGRLLAAVGVEYLDRQDREWWPLVRVPVLYLAPGGLRSFAEGLCDVLGGAAPGVAWQSGDDGALGVQVGAPQGGEGDLLVVEVGIDLSLFLSEAGPGPRRPGAELALFRWQASRAAAVAFTDALRRETAALAGDG